MALPVRLAVLAHSARRGRTALAWAVFSALSVGPAMFTRAS
ncbi:hypothetical protein [Halalkalicoccus jeotgali]|nr:hypothetical protein [Halalkalicoccus jeotgali]